MEQGEQNALAQNGRVLDLVLGVPESSSTPRCERREFMSFNLLYLSQVTAHSSAHRLPVPAWVARVCFAAGSELWPAGSKPYSSGCPSYNCIFPWMPQVLDAALGAGKFHAFL